MVAFSIGGDWGWTGTSTFASGVKLTTLANLVTPNTVYIDPGTGTLTYGAAGGGGISAYAYYKNSAGVIINGLAGDGMLYNTSVVSAGAITTSTVTMVSVANTNATVFHVPSGIYLITYQSVGGTNNNVQMGIWSSLTGAANSFTQVTSTSSSFTGAGSQATTFWTGLLNCTVNMYFGVGYLNATGAITYNNVSISMVKIA